MIQLRHISNSILGFGTLTFFSSVLKPTLAEAFVNSKVGIAITAAGFAIDQLQRGNNKIAFLSTLVFVKTSLALHAEIYQDAVGLNETSGPKP